MSTQETLDKTLVEVLQVLANNKVSVLEVDRIFSAIIKTLPSIAIVPEHGTGHFDWGDRNATSPTAGM